MNKISKEYIPIFKKMFAMVGADIKKVDMTKQDWFHRYSWSVKEEEQFINWLAEYAVKNKLCSKREGGKFALEFVLLYGWIIKLYE